MKTNAWYGIAVGGVVLLAGGYMYYQNVWKPKHVQKIEPVNGGGGGGTVIVRENVTTPTSPTTTPLHLGPVRPLIPKAILNLSVIKHVDDTPMASFNGEIVK